MTIVTKLTDKKKEKEVPLVQHVVTEPTAPADIEAHNIMLMRQRRIPNIRTTTFLLFLIGSFVMVLGLVGGYLFYKQFAQERIQRLRYHGFCSIPYDSNTIDGNAMYYMNNKYRDMRDSSSEYFEPILKVFNKPYADELKDVKDEIEDKKDEFFYEEFDLDLNDESYSKITVPDFRDGRQGRFIHDFKINQSSIIDSDAKRCFIYPLDSENVIKPRSLFDLIIKMQSGFYDIDTDVVRKNMRVVLPEVSDMSDVSKMVQTECQDMKIYKLEQIVSGVYKREISELTENAKFAEYSGKNIVELNLINLEAIENFEKANK